MKQVLYKLIIMALSNISIYLLLHIIFGNFFWGYITGLINMSVNEILIEKLTDDYEPILKKK